MRDETTPTLRLFDVSIGTSNGKNRRRIIAINSMTALQLALHGHKHDIDRHNPLRSLVVKPARI